jgi:hypothetical protein
MATEPGRRRRRAVASTQSGDSGMLRRILLVALALAVPGRANAAVHADGKALATLADLKVVVEDRVAEGCLLDAAGMKDAVERNLSRSDLLIDARSVMTMKLLFSGFDVDPSEDRLLCVVTVDLNLYSYYPGFGPVVFASDGLILSGPQHLDEEALREAQAFADEVVAAVRQARATASAQP